MSQKRNIGKYSVALLAPTSTGQYGQVIEGFQDKLKEILPEAFVYPFYLLGADVASLHACLHQVVQDKYDLVVTIGVNCGRLIADYFYKNNIDIPQIMLMYATFFIQNRHKNLNVTGVYYSVQDLKESIDFLYLAVGSSYDISIPMDIFSFKTLFSKEVEKKELFVDTKLLVDLIKFNDIVDYVENKGLMAKVTKFSSTMDAYSHIYKEKDVLLFLSEGSALLELAPILSEQKKEMLIYSGLIEHVREKKVPLAWGLDHHPLGLAAAQQAMEIVLHQKNSADVMPVELKNKRIPALCKSLARRFKIDIEQVEDFCKNNGGLVVD